MENRGGRRPGAGRKAVPEQQRRKHISLYVKPQTVERMSDLRKIGVSVSREVDRLVEELHTSIVGEKR